MNKIRSAQSSGELKCVEEQESSMEAIESFDTGESELDVIQEQTPGWFGGWLTLRWCNTSMSVLRAAEKRILSYLKTPYRGRYVNVGPFGRGKDDCKIWTLSLNEKGDRTPLVLVHGLGSGVALWALNLDGLAASRPVYAFDLPGFGRSSRPYFSNDAMEAESEYVDAIEEWRREMNLERFVVVGHSMGGFLASSYAIRFPQRISHLILADVWGFPERPPDVHNSKFPIPLWVKMISSVLQPLNPLWGIRLAGPLGPKLIEKARPDLIQKFSSLTDDGDTEIANYIFHCNAQNPTGESAFHSMMSTLGWAKFPMCKRISDLRFDVPLTMIYGSRSWVNQCPHDTIENIRKDSYVNVKVIPGAGHHLYADKKEKFNECVLAACEWSENNQRPSSVSRLSSRHSSIGSEDSRTEVESCQADVNLLKCEINFLDSSVTSDGSPEVRSK